MAGPLLLKNLCEAVDMAKKCDDACRDFEEHRPSGMIYEWKMLKRRWEIDPSQPDPYEVVEKGRFTGLPPLYSVVADSGSRSFKLQFRKTKAFRGRSA
jgi:hypothetical protein